MNKYSSVPYVLPIFHTIVYPLMRRSAPKAYIASHPQSPSLISFAFPLYKGDKVKMRNFPQTHTIRHSTASSLRLVERVAYIELHSNISLSFFEILSTRSILSLGRYDKTCSACYSKESQSSMTFHSSGNLYPITRLSRDFSLYKKHLNS